MCGRFTLHSRDRIKLKGLASLDLPFEARYNIAPSQSVLTIGDFGAGPEGRLMTWGLIPSWSTDGKGFINARAETLEEKPSFSESFRLRRCLIPADGFFEWKRTGREKRPFKPFPSLGMKTYPVSSSVNSPDNDRADLLVRVDTEVGQTLSLF